jgi:uncharacterized protein (DUF488 family)
MEEKRPAMSETAIYTIGYGARPLPEFIATLQAHHIAYLIDVRSKPYSRYRPEFGKSELEAALKEAGIRYVFMGDTLGGQPEDKGCYTEGKVDYEKVRGMDFYREGIGRVQKAYAQQLPVVLLCSEGKPEQCHRSKLIGQTLTELSIPVAHIDENDDLISQAAVLLRLTNNQPSLFGDGFHEFTSRKRYQDEDNELE